MAHVVRPRCRPWFFVIFQEHEKKPLSERYSIGQTVLARVVHVNPATHDVGLSTLDHLLQLSLPRMPPIVGRIFKDATIERIDHGVGILLSLLTEPTPTPGYVVKSMITDDGSFKDWLESGDLHEGRAVEAKAYGFRVMDGLASVCMKESVLKHGVLSYEDVYPGLLVSGTVQKILERTGGALVKLAPEVIGFASELHCEGRTPARLKKVFPIGSKVGRWVAFTAFEQSMESEFENIQNHMLGWGPACSRGNHHRRAFLLNVLASLLFPSVICCPPA